MALTQTSTEIEKKDQFNLISRTHYALYPPKDKTPYAELHSLIAPHLDSFNQLASSTKKSILQHALKDLPKITLFDHVSKLNKGFGNKLSFWLEDVQLARPVRQERTAGLVKPLYPSECREGGITYRGRMQVVLCISLNDSLPIRHTMDMGYIPIMVRSEFCHLYGLGPGKLIQRHEASDEWGGYFIVNGIERLIRLLIVPRRNFPMAVIRSSFSSRGANYTEFGVQIRSVRPDQSSQTNVLHYLNDGTCMFRFSFKKSEYLIPVMLILRGLADVSDRELFDAIVQGDHTNTFMTSRVEVLLKNYRDSPYYSQKKCLAYLGNRFRVVLNLPENASDVENGKELLRRLVLVHLEEPRYKFNLLTFMIRKLYALANGDCTVDNPDSLQNQEVLLGGYLYGHYIKEKWYEYLQMLASVVQRELRFDLKADADQGITLSSGFAHPNFLRKVLKKTPCDIGAKLEYLLATGNVKTQTGMDLQQLTGYTIVAEKLNYYRYLSHFRSVHRGSFFAELKTTTVRKLLPESWGFLCPVHTPDGAPCGLLNHLSHTCAITTQTVMDVPKLVPILTYLGMQPFLPGTTAQSRDHSILLDGCVLGFASPERCRRIAQQLRAWKLEGLHGLPKQLEVGYIPSSQGGQYPGLYLFACPARMVRPVYALPSSISTRLSHSTLSSSLFNSSIQGELQEDWVGSFEQVYMDIAMSLKEVVPGISTHVEMAPTSALSVVANVTPFSDFNQSPRNMYQCQMGKQTMGTPSHTYERRSDNKLYRIQTPQTPIVRPNLHLKYAMDEYPQGTNAVIAVISYTSYDMEDAMIINKSSYERGFGYGTIYKTVQIDLEEYRRTGEPLLHAFYYPKADTEPHPILDADGLPFVGARIQQGDPIACVVDTVTGEPQFVKYKEADDVFVHSVRLVGAISGITQGGSSFNRGSSTSSSSNSSSSSSSTSSSSSSSTSTSTSTDGLCVRAFIQLRMPRPPIIGDKFSSRHGQKGVCSQRWPMVDMPFTESGIVPDVIINPHAFPSRMTIGMLIEQMAAKAGAMLGKAHDATPFQFTESIYESDETMSSSSSSSSLSKKGSIDTTAEKAFTGPTKRTAADYFGEQLVQAGYNYYGNEPMYSGVTGQLLRADIFMGIVYYQRLRHMVSDKFQVRSTGPIHPLTRQPVKGRKMSGGIRFGEMERDALLGHGTAFLLQDRLMHCSDYSQALFCKTCCSFLGCYWTPNTHKETMGITYEGKIYECLQCQQTSASTHGNIVVISVPYVFRYLCTELMGMGIRLKMLVE